MEDVNKLKLTDQNITCVDCGKPFLFNVGEQRYFLSKGLSFPKRCAECRRIRRATIVREDRPYGS